MGAPTSLTSTAGITYTEDDFSLMEEQASELANSMSFHACSRLGVAPEFINEWLNGVRLSGTEGMIPFFFDDYPSLKQNADIAAAELDRLTSRQKIFWYPPGTAPANLSVCPGNLILKGARARVVQDWTRAGLNQRLTSPMFIMVQWTHS